MTRVWICSSSGLQSVALAELLGNLGYSARLQAPAELALWDLYGLEFPFPPPPNVPTLALVEASEIERLELLRLGYRGYLAPDEGKEALAKALAAIERGEIWAERHILGQLLEQQQRRSAAVREGQVLCLIARGLSNRDIAHSLGISEGTVKVHISSLLAKHHVRRRAELIVQHAPRY